MPLHVAQLACTASAVLKPPWWQTPILQQSNVCHQDLLARLDASAETCWQALCQQIPTRSWRLPPACSHLATAGGVLDPLVDLLEKGSDPGRSGAARTMARMSDDPSVLERLCKPGGAQGGGCTLHAARCIVPGLEQCNCCIVAGGMSGGGKGRWPGARDAPAIRHIAPWAM